MSRSGEITLPWGDGERTFRLTVTDWEKVQEKCDAGPAEILSRLAPLFTARSAGIDYRTIIANGYIGTWRVHDVREPLYRGLMRGEGLDPTAAGKVIRELVDERPLIESVVMAYQVVLASLVGAEDESPDDAEGEPEGEVTPANPSPAAKSASPDTTEAPP
jgi:hypothetical protein